MPSRGRWGSLQLAWLLGLVAASAAGAPRFELVTRSIVIPERGEVPACALRLETNEVTFIPPPGWVVRTVPEEKKVTLRSQDGTAMITLKFAEPPTNRVEEVKRDWARDQIRERLPQAKILEEYTCYTGVAAGPAFDLEPASSTPLKPFSRVAFVAIPGYLLELNATASNGQLKQWQFPFANLCASLRVEPLAPAPVPRK